MTSRTVFFNVIRFVFLLFFQVLILNHINKKCKNPFWN